MVQLNAKIEWNRNKERKFCVDTRAWPTRTTYACSHCQRSTHDWANIHRPHRVFFLVLTNINCMDFPQIRWTCIHSVVVVVLYPIAYHSTFHNVFGKYGITNQQYKSWTLSTFHCHLESEMLPSISLCGLCLDHKFYWPIRQSERARIIEMLIKCVTL